MQKPILFFFALIAVFQNSNIASFCYTDMPSYTLSKASISSSPTTTHSEYHLLYAKYQLLTEKLVQQVPETQRELQTQLELLNELIPITKRIISILNATSGSFKTKIELEAQLQAFITIRYWATNKLRAEKK